MNEWIKREEERLMAGKQSPVEQASKKSGGEQAKQSKAKQKEGVWW